MGRQPKSTAKASVGSLFIAQIDGTIAKHRPPKVDLGPFKKSRINSLRKLNALCYSLSAIIVLFSISTSSWDGYDNYYDGMGNQTLLSVAPYAEYIWYALYFLQGLFVAASYMPSLWSSEYLGYTALNHTRSGWKAFKKSIPVEHFPVLCASTAISVYSYFKMNNMSLALGSSCASTIFLIVIIRYQFLVTPPPISYEDHFRGIKGWFRRRRVDEELLNEELHDQEFRSQIQQYFFLKLPFELYAGYNLAWSVSIVSIIVHREITNEELDVVLAWASLVALLAVGCYVMWSEKKGMFYGVGAGLAWYLFGVFFELLYPSSTVVYNFYADAAIAVTKYMAVSFASLFVAAVVVRAIKYVIKGGHGLHEEDSEEDEDDVRKIVLHGIAAAESGGKHMIHEAEDGVVHVSTTVLPAVAKAVGDTSTRSIQAVESTGRRGVQAVASTGRRGVQAVASTGRRGVQAVASTHRRIIEEAGDGVDNISVEIDKALDEAEDGVIGALEAMGI